MRRAGIVVTTVILLVAAWLTLQKPVGRALGLVDTSEQEASTAIGADKQPSSGANGALPEKLTMVYWDRMRAITQAQLSNIHFFGRVIDQDNNPVAGAIVEFDAYSGYLAAGSGVQRVTTDADGIFEIVGVHGDGFSIRSITRPNYDFRFAGSNIREFENYRRFQYSVLWHNYTRDNPYVYRMWKVERYERLKAREELGFHLVPDGRPYMLDITNEGREILTEGETGNGQLTVAVTRNDIEWILLLRATNGSGLVDADGIYLNRAPQSGYKQALEYHGTRETDAEALVSVYIKSSNGYARLKMIIHPFFKQARVELSYAANSEGGVELSTPRALEDHSMFDLAIRQVHPYAATR